MRYLLFLFSIILFSTCSKDVPTVSGEPQLIWKKSLKGDTLTACMIPKIYNDIVIYNQTEITNYYHPIIAYDKNTGNKIWTWLDYIGEHEGIYGMITSTIVKDNIFTFATHIGIYAIDVTTGQTLWQNTHETQRGHRDITNFGDKIFHITLQPDRNEYYLNIADIHTGNWQTIYSTTMKDNYTPSLLPPSFYIDNNGDTLLLFTNNTYDFSTQKGLPFFICYNLTKKEIVYEKEVTSPTFGYGIVKEPIVYNDKAYFHVGPFMYCYDIATGEKRWSKRLEDIVGTIGFILQDDRLFVGIEGSNPQLYALEPETGIQLWKIKSSGTSSKMQYYNGVIYFNGGGNGLLHAVNAQKGEYIWQYSSPDLKHNSGAWFDSAISIDKATGRIYTSNYLNALCFEAM